MRVLVTGGTGVVGKEVVKRLLQHGWDVRVVSNQAGTQVEGADYVMGDIMDYPALREHMRGYDAVVHLAAIANPIVFPGPQTFNVNVSGTFNVFEAAAHEGIKRVVQASSINALGCAWSIGDIAPKYFPIDEAHPTYTTDVYSFSKNMIEDIGDYYWRREGISSVALRFPGVMTVERKHGDMFREHRVQLSALLDELAAQPDDVRTARLAEAREWALEFRRQRSMEYKEDQQGRRPPIENLLWKAYAIDRFNYWAYVDERDSAQAIDKALTAEYEGSYPLFINGAHNWLGYDSEALLKLFYPDVEARTLRLQGAETLVSIDKARDLIGYEPEYVIEESLSHRERGTT